MIREIEAELERLGARLGDEGVGQEDAVRVEPFEERVKMHFGPTRAPYVCPPDEALERLRRLPAGAGPGAVRSAFGQRT